MADNVTTQTATLATIPTATAIATDDEAGVHYQKVKLADGTSGATTPIAAGGGVEAGALRVTVASDSTGVLSVDDNGASLTVDGTVTAHAGTGPWPVTDNGGTLSVDDGGGSLTIDGTVTAHAGTGPWPVTDNGGSLTVDVPDGSAATVGAKADAKSSATDTTAITVMQVLKQLSYNTQIGNPPTISKHISNGGTLTASPTVNSVTLTQSGMTAVEVEITNVTGSAAIYITLDGTSPSTTNFIAVLPATPSSITLPCYDTSPTIKMLTSGTPTYAATLRGF